MGRTREQASATDRQGEWPADGPADGPGDGSGDGPGEQAPRSPEVPHPCGAGTTMSDDALAEGLYGPAGWVARSGVREVLEPHLEGWRGDATDFARFGGIGDDVAAALLDLLPQANLEDQQNMGPTCRALLEAAVAHPGDVVLSGYLVSAPRWDERVSVDGVVVMGAACAAASAEPRPPSAGSPTTQGAVWEVLRRALGLGRETGMPDEVIRVLAEGRAGRPGWWLWWD